MKDKLKIQAEQREMLRAIEQESGMTLSAIARVIKVAPSTLNKVAQDDDRYTHVISTPVLSKLADFRRSLGNSRRPDDAQIGAYPVDQSENDRLLFMWGRLDHPTKVAALEILDAITRIASRKVT